MVVARGLSLGMVELDKSYLSPRVQSAKCAVTNLRRKGTFVAHEWCGTDGPAATFCGSLRHLLVQTCDFLRNRKKLPNSHIWYKFYVGPT